MIEVLWHGRGGQGAFTAARLLGAAASMAEGSRALAFPAFGPERRGAPMRAYTKIADAVIGDRSAIKQADYVIYLDDTLLAGGWEAELKSGGIVLVNSVESFDDERVVALDADGISVAVLGRPIPNTVFLGALSVLCEQVEADDVKEAIRQYMPEKLHAKNIAILDRVRELLQASGDCPELGVDEAEEACATLHEGETAGAAEYRKDCVDTGGEGLRVRPSASIPVLRDDVLDPDDFARTTCFEAGHLVTKNAGWRNVRPVIDRVACTGCLQCYLYCPDGTVFKIDGLDGKTAVAIDYDFCKGCGICAKICAVDAIDMIFEKEALAAEAAEGACAGGWVAADIAGGDVGSVSATCADDERAAASADGYESEADAR